MAYWTDRPPNSQMLPLEGWVRSGPSSRLEIRIDLAEDRGGEAADRRQERECRRRDEDEDERVFDKRLSLFAVPQAQKRAHDQLVDQSALLFETLTLVIAADRLG